ncbi:hypothetical protein TRFO_31634 [Tritrichomonas foetus]|uniref:Uncharacterized protein n=1 Tax=Tritrichomonas foetus TaxID=1144522 RepID=A0A1J4JW67_9EUKA|nr:hypothetical protein TRFO_31634 [Tritrichomonas foetus]|eukprot:OHT01533.1 hypothetical protein TRFO_31634 [Tritrichomonas foetus]
MNKDRYFLKETDPNELLEPKPATLTRSVFSDPGYIPKTASINLFELPTLVETPDIEAIASPRSMEMFPSDADQEEGQINPDDDEFLYTLYNQQEQQYSVDKEFPYRIAQIKQAFNNYNIEISCQQHELFALQQCINQMDNYIDKLRNENYKIKKLINEFDEYNNSNNKPKSYNKNYRNSYHQNLEQFNLQYRSQNYLDIDQEEEKIEMDDHLNETYSSYVNRIGLLTEASLTNSNLIEKIELYQNDNKLINKYLACNQKNETNEIIQRLENEIEKTVNDFEILLSSYEQKIQEKDIIIYSLKEKLANPMIDPQVSRNQSSPNLLNNSALPKFAMEDFDENQNIIHGKTKPGTRVSFGSYGEPGKTSYG